MPEKVPLNKWEWLETWKIPAVYPPSHGTVLLFPGNGGVKGTQLLAPVQVFHRLGYETILVDFCGVGGTGNRTTLGVREAKDVAQMMQHIQDSNGTPIILYGVSMGMTAILKAIAHHHLQPDAIILELPFIRLLASVKRRLAEISIPTSPLAELVVFGGAYNIQECLAQHHIS